MRVHREGDVVVLEVWFAAIFEIGRYDHRTAWLELQTAKVIASHFPRTSKWLLEKPDALAL